MTATSGVMLAFAERRAHNSTSPAARNSAARTARVQRSRPKMAQPVAVHGVEELADGVGVLAASTPR